MKDIDFASAKSKKRKLDEMLVHQTVMKIVKKEYQV